jgi:hypothetical protein
MLKQKNQSETPCIKEVSDWFRQRTEKNHVLQNIFKCFYE